MFEHIAFSLMILQPRWRMLRETDYVWSSWQQLCLPSIIDVVFETVSRIFQSIFNFRELNSVIRVQFCVM